MAYIKTRLRVFGENGWDTTHLESRSDLIMRVTSGVIQSKTVETSLQDLETSTSTLSSSKVDKVQNPNVDNFASLAANGNLKDSGKNTTSFASALHSHAMADLATLSSSKAVITDANGKLLASAVTTTEMGYLSGVTSAIQTQLNGKSPSSHTHTVANITALTANKAVVTDANGKLSASTVTSTEISYLAGLTSSVQTQLNAKAASNHNHDSVYLKSSLKGAASGLAELDTSGKVPASQLPSYVDDVIEGTLSTFPSAGETGKIYVDTTTNKTYRWSGSAYSVISETIALGETSATAYRGDRGKIAYDHSQATHARTDATAVKYVSNGIISINGTNATIYTHPATAGNKHIPSGGATNQLLGYSAAGTAAWKSPATAPASGSALPITAGGVYTALQSYLPKANPVVTGSLTIGSMKISYDTTAKELTFEVV